MQHKVPSTHIAVKVMVALFAAAPLVVPARLFAAHTKAETEAPANDNPGPLATPKGAMAAYDAALPAGGIDAAKAAYQYDGDKQARVAEAMARLDLVTSELQAKVKEKLGAAAADAALHAARNETVKDLQDAEAKIDGDHAVITWKDGRAPVPMILVDGKWKVSVAQVLQDVGKDVDIDDLVQSCDEVARQLRRTTEELSAGEYPNQTLLERAIGQRMYRVLGEDKQ